MSVLLSNFRLEFKATILLQIWQIYKQAFLDMDVDEMPDIERHYGTITFIIQEFKRWIDELEQSKVED